MNTTDNVAGILMTFILAGIVLTGVWLTALKKEPIPPKYTYLECITVHHDFYGTRECQVVGKESPYIYNLECPSDSLFALILKINIDSRFDKVDEVCK